MKYFTKDHEWVSVEGLKATLGITNYAQKSLGDVVYLELPEPGSEIKQGKIFGVVESVKAVSDLYAPLSGRILETHVDLVQNPEHLNQDPENKYWMLKITLDSPEEVKTLLTQEQYKKYLDEEVK